ncbi:hypothetical protein GCM10010278_81000 [Streptomyces melanogenes]|nr:hypothetical protein GCM10010278_81000 [Streptomyces melanogenes]
MSTLRNFIRTSKGCREPNCAPAEVRQTPQARKTAETLPRATVGTNRADGYRTNTPHTGNTQLSSISTRSTSVRQPLAELTMLRVARQGYEPTGVDSRVSARLGPPADLSKR